MQAARLQPRPSTHRLWRPIQHHPSIHRLRHAGATTSCTYAGAVRVTSAGCAGSRLACRADRLWSTSQAPTDTATACRPEAPCQHTAAGTATCTIRWCAWSHGTHGSHGCHAPPSPYWPYSWPAPTTLTAAIPAAAAATVYALSTTAVAHATAPSRPWPCANLW